MNWAIRLAAPAALFGTLALMPVGDTDQGSTVHYDQRDQQLRRYAYVPFTVEPGTTRVSVSYSYDRSDGGNVVDLGLYEPGPLTFGTSALRGWSGGSYDTISVSTGDATPGYWPGPIPAGEWHVIFGLYKVASKGVDVRVKIQLVSGGAPTDATPSQTVQGNRVVKTGPAWYAGALHTHTTHSDGALSPEQLVDTARAEGLDFIAITDHNNTVHQLSNLRRPDLLVITGEEVTTPGGHFNVWGLGGQRDYLDFRILPGDPALRALVDAAHQRGAVVAINHPFSDCLACSWTHAVPDDVDAIEIANGTTPARQQAMAMWDVLLRSGHRVTAVGESDWHRGPAPVGTPSVRVWATELSAAAVLDAIRHGRVVVTANDMLPPPEFTIESAGQRGRVGDRLMLRRGDDLRISVMASASGYSGASADLVSNGEVIDRAVLLNGRATFMRAAATSGYLRVHLMSAAQEMMAITNPVFVTVR